MEELYTLEDMLILINRRLDEEGISCTVYHDNGVVVVTPKLPVYKKGVSLSGGVFNTKTDRVCFFVSKDFSISAERLRDIIKSVVGTLKKG